MFPGRTPPPHPHPYPVLSLSLSFFLSRGLEKRFGREGEGWFQAPCIPQSTVREGGGLPAQAAICNILRTAGTRAARQ